MPASSIRYEPFGLAQERQHVGFFRVVPFDTRTGVFQPSLRLLHLLKAVEAHGDEEAVIGGRVLTARASIDAVRSLDQIQPRRSILLSLTIPGFHGRAQWAVQPFRRKRELDSPRHESPQGAGRRRTGWTSLCIGQKIEQEEAQSLQVLLVRGLEGVDPLLRQAGLGLLLHLGDSRDYPGDFFLYPWTIQSQNS